MKCPYCGEDNNIVIDSHNYTKDRFRLRRRRRCYNCGERFTTVEEVYNVTSGVKDKKVMEYNRAVLSADNNSKFCKGVHFEVLGYSKSYNQYYVRPLEGTVTHWVDGEDLIFYNE